MDLISAQPEKGNLSKLENLMLASMQKGNVHESTDAILMAMVFLSHQKKNKNYTACRYVPLKHIIESTAGRYISTDDVIVAARLLGLKGRYPVFNLRFPLKKPPKEVFLGITEYGAHPQYFPRFRKRKRRRRRY
jgi:hypothetical protein